MKPLLSLQDLSSRIGFALEELRAVAKDIGRHYRAEVHVDNETGHFRQLHIPGDKLKDIQRRINRHILSRLPLSDCAHGSIRGRSCATNAREHRGQACLVNLDARQFFPTISHRLVYRVLRHVHGMGRDVASLITKLTTFKGALPQGSPTSAALSNLVLTHGLDKQVTAEAHRRDLHFTRYLDDFAISGENPRSMINLVAKELSRHGLSLHRQKPGQSKLRISSQRSRQEVTGLVVNARNSLSVARIRRDRVRAAVLELSSVTDPTTFRRELDSVRGRISYVLIHNPGAAERLERYLDTRLAAHPLRGTRGR